MKAAFAAKGCKIISEESPNKMVLKQGSLWGMSPKTAKKKIALDFAPDGSRTHVTCSSRLNSDWKNLTLVGCALAAVLVGLCLWMTLDLDAFMANQNPSFWSWLGTVNGSIDFQVGLAFANLTKALAVFLSIIIVSEIAIVVYVHSGIDQFAKQIINSLSTETAQSATKKIFS